MSDISQHGLIGTLQRLAEHPALHQELEAVTRHQPAVLILPCHIGELRRPALKRILRELEQARFLSEILIPLNGTDAQGVVEARCFFRAHTSRPHRVLWCDPLREHGIAGGKGSNVWAAIGLLARERKAATLLLADADVTTFRLEMLARLLYSVAEPTFGYTFAKCYYPRVSDRIHGRVSRLFFAPLLQALVRAGGHQPLLDFLRSFRYPLAGECAFTLELAASLPLETGWGLETGMLCDLFRLVDPRQVCQVDAGIRYDHKHQPLGDQSSGLLRMSREIAHTLLFHLEREGVRIDPSFCEALEASYRREAVEAMRRSAALAKINGLRYLEEEECRLVESFCAVLSDALHQRSEITTLPPWNYPTPEGEAALEAVLEDITPSC
ncbi:hypothetical protein [uncultured Pigmentiphaga sp.]|uniref:hypothetical protein n=1 Tax=uncultured Pigmentiphaga sp. TaxID=340361 RepID=UPI002619B457|nr:hypothetical protein [uncultured Pigmentiphaga sp.]